MKITLLVVCCLFASALGMKKFMKEDVDTFGMKKILFYKMIFGDKLGELMVQEMTLEERLVFDLLKVYNKHINPPGTTNLKFSIAYVCANVDKMTLMMTSRVVEEYLWMDKRLKWNPVEYNGITEIRFPAKKIWTPDMKLFNSHIEEEVRDEINVVIKHDGTVLWIPLVTYKTNCLPTTTITGGDIFNFKSTIGENKTNFKCKLVIGSWTLDDKILKLTTEGEGLKMTEYLDTCKHDITGVKAMIKDHTYDVSPNENYPALHLEFNVKEREGIIF